jgi:hypothetical protein
MPTDGLIATPRGVMRGVAMGIDVSGFSHLPGIDDVPRLADRTVSARALCAYADTVDESLLDSDDQALELAVLFDRITAWAQGRQASALAEFARRPRTLCEDPVVNRAQRAPVGRDIRELGGGEEVAAALRLSVRSGQNRLGLATTMAGSFPATLAALTRGEIDLGRAMALVGEAAACTNADRRAQIEAAVLAGGRRGTPSQFGQAARRAVLRIDAEAARRKADQCRHNVYVATGPSSTDTSYLDGQLPAEDAMAIRLVLDAAATALSGTGETRTRDQLRVAALAAPFWAALSSGRLDMVGGPLTLAVAHGQVPALDLDVEPAADAVAELRGFGPVTPQTAREVAARAQVGRWPVVRIHDRAGAARDAAQVPAEPGYRPSAALERRIIDRDQQCRFPGCTAAPARCDVDHTIPWPLGPSHEGNPASAQYDPSVCPPGRSTNGASGVGVRRRRTSLLEQATQLGSPITALLCPSRSGWLNDQQGSAGSVEQSVGVKSCAAGPFDQREHGAP